MILQLTLRNLKIYFRDRASVFFSLLSVIIVVSLFVLFLAKMQTDSIASVTNVSEDKISYLVNTWILGGLLSITTITGVLGGYGSMINDRENKIIMGFKSAPIKPYVYPFVNVLSSFIIGVIISVLTLLIYSACTYFVTGYLLTFHAFFLSIVLILFSTLINAFILGFVCSYLKTRSSFTSVSILVGTITGFINGVYVPLGSLGDGIRATLSAFPSLQIAAMFRNVLTLDAINEVFLNAPDSAIVGYRDYYGIVLSFGETNVSTTISILYCLLFGCVCGLLMIRNVQKKDKGL